MNPRAVPLFETMSTKERKNLAKSGKVRSRRAKIRKPDVKDRGEMDRKPLR